MGRGKGEDGEWGGEDGEEGGGARYTNIILLRRK